MHEVLDGLCDSLCELSKAVLSSSKENRTLREVFGWSAPAITRRDIAAVSSRLADEIRESALDSLPEEVEEELAGLSERVDALRTDTLQYIFNGNAAQAVPAYMETLSAIRSKLAPVIGWQRIENRSLPPALVRRLRATEAQLNELAPRTDELRSQIQLINDAVATAEALPADLESLREAKSTVSRIASEAAEVIGKIGERLVTATTSAGVIEGKEGEASRLVSLCEEAYRITTTKGLAAAFDQRARKLAQSMWVWVFGLLCALAAAIYFGSKRIDILSSELSSTNPHWGAIWMNVTLSALSVAAPVWFAWLATKQIGQVFRLSEDYAFKASVAKAYEGYRKEAARLDEAFEARLFSSALTRLEEAPLRLVEAVSPGSPWHELVNSEAFQRAIGIVPELRSKFIDVSRKVRSAPTVVEESRTQNELGEKET